MFKPTETFTSWGHKKSGWTNTEQMARDLQNYGYSGLLCKIAGVDLFAAEAHFHQPFYSKFYSKHQTWRGCMLPNADEKMWILKCLQHMPLHMNP